MLPTLDYRSVVEKLPFVELVFPLDELLISITERSWQSPLLSFLFTLLTFRRPSYLGTFLECVCQTDHEIRFQIGLLNNIGVQLRSFSFCRISLSSRRLIDRGIWHQSPLRSFSFYIIIFRRPSYLGTFLASLHWVHFWHHWLNRPVGRGISSNPHFRTSRWMLIVCVSSSHRRDERTWVK